MKKLTTFLISVLAALMSETTDAQNQFTVTPCQNAQEVIALTDSVLLGNIPPDYKNDISFTGDPQSVGYFTNGTFLGFGHPAGMIMTTGKAEYAAYSNECNTLANASYNNTGPNEEPDLEQLSGHQVNDACIISFDVFITEDSMSLNYVFASEEYHEYVFSTYNDVFGFFLSGQPINGGYSNNAELISLVPESTVSVDINSINFGLGGNTCTGTPTGCTNCQYFRDNSQNADPAFNFMVYDGYTVPLQGTHHVLKNHWYHVKLAIADVNDAVFDSGIFLEKNFLTQYPLTGTAGQKDRNIRIFPNPVSDFLYLRFGTSAPWHLCLKDMRGRILFEKSGISGQTSVNMKGYRQGLYFMELTVNGTCFRQKVVRR